MAQGRITKTTNFSGFAINGAALLAGFYHRSVLRCGCLAERNSGVAGILTAARPTENKSCELSRIRYPGQHGMRNSNLWNAAPSGTGSTIMLNAAALPGPGARQNSDRITAVVSIQGEC
jgi:hypothetical protein